MSKQKILTVVGVVLLVVLVIVAFGFKGKYDDASSLLIAAQADAADQKKAADAEIESLSKQIEDAQAQLAALQAELDAATASAAELTAQKESAEKLATENEAIAKEAADALSAETAALATAKAELETAATAATEAEAALQAMTAQYNRANADLQAKITRYNIVRESHAKLAEKYDQLKLENTANAERVALLTTELEKAAAEEVEYAEPERYVSQCGVSFVLPEGAKIGNESSKMVEILLTEDASIKISLSTGRVNILWFGAETDEVNQLTATLALE